MKLSRNFFLNEFTRSHTATRLGLNNEPTALQVDNLQELITNVLQPLRDGLKQEVKISSGFRGVALNKAIGGSKRSQHCKGEAADIDSGSLNEIIFNYIVDNLEFDQLINENNFDWIHVSFKSKGNRKQVLKMIKGRYYNVG